jgi:hypothetical protein
MTAQPLDAAFDTSRATFDGTTLDVTTGEIRRTWTWTGRGFLTTAVANAASGEVWQRDRAPGAFCDWILPGWESDALGAELTDLRAGEADDEGFTSAHLAVTADLTYSEARMAVRFVIWAYPGAPGLRTQLHVRGLPGYRVSERMPDRLRQATLRMDTVPVDFAGVTRRAFGYYNNTQRRNDAHLDILKEAVVDRPLRGTEWYDWPSALCLERGGEGLALVKESYKCVNQTAVGGGVVECGVFTCSPALGLTSTGWGIRPDEVVTDRFREAWASWCLVYGGGDHAPDDARELAFKRFGRQRYPLDPDRDLYTMANPWGSSGLYVDGESLTGRSLAAEENVLREIESQADLGLDVQQIDDGWQVAPDAEHTWQCERWAPHPARYPEGWDRVRARADELGVTLGLWAPAEVISLEELKVAYDAGDFRYYKLDFANLTTRDALDDLMAKVRAFIKYTDHRVRVNWDVTENPPRVGYFFAREYGSLYLENRKPSTPPHAVYRPHTVLGDAWLVSKYLNLTKVQVSVQNPDRVDPQRSDARFHPHPYTVAITLMASPIFFQLTQLYDDHARDAIRALLAVYKEHRAAMARGYVFPIGQKPDNGSWTGFQCHDFASGTGYLTIFRERNQPEPERELALRFAAGRRLEIMDLMRGASRTVDVGEDGKVWFRIEHPADFRFLRYVPAG